MNHPDQIFMAYDFQNVSQEFNTIYPFPYFSRRIITLRLIKVINLLTEIDTKQLDVHMQDKLNDALELLDSMDD